MNENKSCQIYGDPTHLPYSYIKNYKYGIPNLRQDFIEPFNNNKSRILYCEIFQFYIHCPEIIGNSIYHVKFSKGE